MSFKSYLLIFISVTIILLASCNRSADKKIDEDLFINLYTDVLLIAELDYPNDDVSLYRENLDSLLTIYNVPYEKFQYTLEFYQEDIFRWKEFMEKVLQKLEDRLRQDFEAVS